MALAADWLKPIYEHIRTGVMAGGYVQVDETPIDYLEPGNGKTKQGYLWTGSRPGGDVFYRWETSRAAACLDNVIPVNFSGTLQCDGYSAYRTFANGRAGTPLNWPAAGHMCGGSFTKRWNNRPEPRLARAANPTPLPDRSCFARTPGRSPTAPGRARQPKPPHR